MKEKIIQFGTGNFLRGFADYFIDSLNKQGLYDGKTVIVSPTDSENVKKINEQNGKYHLILRGIENGREICEMTEINSVSRAVNPYRDFRAFLSLAENPDMRFIISNTTEAGICFDDSCSFDDKPASSFPGKLTQLMYKRYQKGLEGFVILACELIDDNGRKLKDCVLQYAEKWGLGENFKNWIKEKNRFCNTLVDRIVTGYPKDEAEEIFKKSGFLDMLLDTAEPYNLWVIEGDYEQELPLKKGGFNVIWTDDVSPYKKMKVRILNGSHTSLVFPSLLCGVETVGDSLKDSLLNDYLHACLFDCILPTLGVNTENMKFASSVLERFANPYIRHLWRSISLNSVSKFTVRVLPAIKDYYQKNENLPKVLVFSLSCLIKYYKDYEPNDSKAVVDYIKTHDTGEILKKAALWGEDLSFMTEIVNESLAEINKDGIREAVKWSMS